MKMLLRTAVIGALACLAVPVLPQTALADTAEEAPGTGAYFWQGKQQSVVAGQPNPVVGADTDADGVARDELAVAVTAPGRTDKETFLQWDLLALGPNDTITGFVVTVPLSESGPNPDPAQNTVQSGQTPELQACMPKGGFGSTDAGSYDTKPEVDLAVCVPGSFDAAKKAYVFDVTPLTATWLTDSNNGIAIVPIALDQPFQVVFKKIDAITAAITFTAGEDPFAEDVSGGEDVATGEDPGFSSGDSGAVGFDSGVDSGFDSSFDSGGSVLSSAPLTVFDAPLTAGDALAEPVTAPEPTVADGEQVSTAPVALRSVPGSPPLGFWVAAIALGLLLVAFSIATGSPLGTTAARAPRREGRVLRQVQAMALTRRAT